LNNAPANTYVLLGAGTFLINSSLSVPSNVTLRGSGADQTILNVKGTSGAAINIGSLTVSYPPASSSITSGASAGSTSIVVAGASGISVGNYMMITELDDPSFVTSTGTEGACTWCDYGWGGTRDRGQIVEVTSVNGTTIGFTPALYTNYSHTPYASLITAEAKYAGVEDLQIYANNTGYCAMIGMYQAAYCWIKGCHINFTDNDTVDIFFGYRNEVLNNYIHDAYLHSAGDTDSEMAIRDKTTGCLIENNIFSRHHVNMMTDWGAAGNVIAYNYMFGNFDSSATNVLMSSTDEHGAHPQFNLYESNVVEQHYTDSVWGSNGPETFFRNYSLATTQICNPLSGRGAISCSGSNGWWSNQANRAVQIAQLSYDVNLVGNVLGSTQAASQMAEEGLIASPTGRNYDYTAYDCTMGYGEESDGTGPYSSVSADTQYRNALIHGNYTHSDGSITWASGVTQSLPASLVHSSKPSWFGSVPWPAIGPDVTGGTGPGGYAYSIPAQACYNNSAKDSNGYAVFNEKNCYAAGNSTTYTVTPSAGLDGSISPSSPQSVSSGSTTQFTITPAGGCGISSVTGCGGTLSGNIYTTGAITGNCTVTATFASNIRTYTITSSVAGSNGSISPSGAVTATSGCTRTFTVTPAFGYTASVHGTCGGTLSGATYTTNPVKANCTVTASFARRSFIRYEVSPFAGPNGSLSPSAAQRSPVTATPLLQ
jgi:hypothetical protein